MSLSVDTTLMTNLTTAIGNAHLAYVRSMGGNRQDDDGGQGSPFNWLELCKSLVQGGNALQTGIVSGSTLAVASNSNATVNVTGGNVLINGQTVAVATNAAYGSSSIFSQTCTDGSALLSGQYYYAALVTDHLGVLSVLRGPRDDRPNSASSYPLIPSGYCLLAWIKVNYNASATSIASGDITLGTTLTAYAAGANDAVTRMFNDFDTGQSRLVSKAAVKAEMGFALTSLNNYIATVTGPLGAALNGGAGFSTIQAWARSTHQTGSPFDFPPSFVAFYRALKGGRDPSVRLATISFTGPGTATVTDLKKVVGLQDKLELVVTSAVSTGAATSSISVTTQSYGATTAVVYGATVPANSPNGTVIALSQTGTAALQTPLVGTALNTAIANSTVLATQNVSQAVWTALVPTSPVSVSGGTSGDAFAVRNVGTL